MFWWLVLYPSQSTEIGFRPRQAEKTSTTRDITTSDTINLEILVAISLLILYLRETVDVVCISSRYSTSPSTKIGKIVPLHNDDIVLA